MTTNTSYLNGAGERVFFSLRFAEAPGIGAFGIIFDFQSEESGSE
jgi:hypothetical protein